MSAKREILIVDDDPALIRFVTKVLESLEDVVVRGYESPLDALAAFKANPSVCLVITDFRMPEMNGVEFARRVRGLNPGIPIIALTAFVNALHDQEMFDEAIAKPFDVEELTRRVVAYFQNDEIRNEDE